MKFRNREINVFSMSALDLFASALGAFILITVVLFPYFPNTGDSAERVADIKVQLKAVEQRLQACETARQQAEQQARETAGQLKQCRDELSKKFLLVLMSWGTRDDIDLHIINPQGKEFYYKRKRFPGVAGALEEDNISGPGNEIWLHPAATPGDYKIYYKFYRMRVRGGARVRGSVLTPEGKTPLPVKHMTRQGEKILIAVVKVDEQGRAHVQVR